MHKDFTGLAPRAKSLEEAQEIIDILWQLLRDNQTRIKTLEEEVKGQAVEIKSLKDQLTKNSLNSSKPPSSDGYNKPSPKSLRVKKNRRPGGQKGHFGQTLTAKEMPDKIIIHGVEVCVTCKSSLSNVKARGYEKRQLFDIPLLKIEVCEHQVEIKKCDCCGKINKGLFPIEVKETVQYGTRIKSLIVYLNHYQLLPYERLREFFMDVFNQPISAGTLYNINNDVYHQLEKTDFQIKELLQNSSLLHSDESGMRVNKKLYWLHVASTAKLTHYDIHEKRGHEAIDEMNILPRFKGTLVHDHFNPYFK